jgi:hypothetical protein
MVAFSRPSTPRPQHFIDCPRHPNNLRHSALTMNIVPDCLASCPMSPSYYQLAPFHAELDGLFPEPGVTDILFDFYANKPPNRLAGGINHIAAEKNGQLYVYDCVTQRVAVRSAIPGMISFQMLEDQDNIIAISAEGKLHDITPLSNLAESLQREVKGLPVALMIARVIGIKRSLIGIVAVDGQIFVGQPRNIIFNIRLASKPKAIACGENHFIVQLKDGQVLTWGDNEQGKLGHGNTTPQETPHPITMPAGRRLAEIEEIAAGLQHTVIQFKNGGVYTCGANRNGQLGCGDARPFSASWAPVKGLPPGVKFSLIAGAEHTVAWGEDGSLWLWGCNDYGSLVRNIIPTAFYSAIPVAQEHWGHIVAVSAARASTIILVEKGGKSEVYRITGGPTLQLIMNLSALEAEHLHATLPPSIAAASSGASSIHPPAAAAAVPRRPSAEFCKQCHRPAGDLGCPHEG